MQDEYDNFEKEAGKFENYDMPSPTHLECNALLKVICGFQNGCKTCSLVMEALYAQFPDIWSKHVEVIGMRLNSYENIVNTRNDEHERIVVKLKVVQTQGKGMSY
jgi:hypothetical protein